MTFNRWSEMTTINIPSVKEARAAAAEEPVLFPDPAQITDEYLALSYRYRFLFGTFLIDETGMDSFDERLAGRGIAACGDDEKDFYQKYDSLSLKYFYIRGIARVERLDEKDRDRLSLLFTKNDDGSWSWWPGMKGSPYMTVSVTQTLVRLNHMIGKQQNTATMVKSAFDFLGQYLVDEMKETKKEAKNNKNVRPSETAMQIMYTFALDGRKLPSAVNDAQKYFIGLLRDKATEFTIYGKATAAVIFAANKEKQLADEFVESISQYSVMTEEAGRYFDTKRAYYSWCDYKIPTEVAAIEAFKAVRPNDLQTVEEMQRWLLHEKRGHSWNTYINTVNAAYAFLDGNLQALDNGEQTRFTLNGKNIHIDGATAGLGYVKTTVPANGSQAFAAEKTSQGTSWGALYAQFDQKSTEVTASASEISVKREIVGNPAELKVGDRIRVRITMKAERDLDFVQVVDRRAACMEPVSQLSGYRNGYYCAPQDNQTCYYFDRMSKGTHVIETEYYIDRAGTYDTGTCKAQCAYAPEYVGTAPAYTLVVR